MGVDDQNTHSNSVVQNKLIWIKAKSKHDLVNLDKFVMPYPVFEGKS